MKKKKIIAFLLVIVLTISSAFSGLAVKVEADSNRENSVEELARDKDYLISSLVPQQELLQKKLEDSIVISEEGGNEVATISDVDMIKSLQSSGFQVSPELVRAYMMRGAGVTKLVWYGNKKSGNFNVYISKNMLQAIKTASAGYNVIMAAFSAYFGNFISSAVNMMKATFKLIQATNIKNGKVYYGRSWRLNGSGNQ